MYASVSDFFFYKEGTYDETLYGDAIQTLCVKNHV